MEEIAIGAIYDALEYNSYQLLFAADALDIEVDELKALCHKLNIPIGE